MAIIELFVLIGEVISGLFNKVSKKKNEVQPEVPPNWMDKRKSNQAISSKRD